MTCNESFDVKRCVGMFDAKMPSSGWFRVVGVQNPGLKVFVWLPQV